MGAVEEFQEIISSTDDPIEKAEAQRLLEQALAAQKSDQGAGAWLKDRGREALTFGQEVLNTGTGGFYPKLTDALGLSTPEMREGMRRESPTASDLGKGTGYGLSAIAGPARATQAAATQIAERIPWITAGTQRMLANAGAGAALGAAETGDKEGALIGGVAGAYLPMVAEGAAPIAKAVATPIRAGVERASPWVKSFLEGNRAGAYDSPIVGPMLQPDGVKVAHKLPPVGRVQIPPDDAVAVSVRTGGVRGKAIEAGRQASQEGAEIMRGRRAQDIEEHAQTVEPLKPYEPDPQPAQDALQATIDKQKASAGDVLPTDTANAIARRGERYKQFLGGKPIRGQVASEIIPVKGKKVEIQPREIPEKPPETYTETNRRVVEEPGEPVKLRHRYDPVSAKAVPELADPADESRVNVIWDTDRLTGQQKPAGFEPKKQTRVVTEEKTITKPKAPPPKVQGYEVQDLDGELPLNWGAAPEMPGLPPGWQRPTAANPGNFMTKDGRVVFVPSSDKQFPKLGYSEQLSSKDPGVLLGYRPGEPVNGVLDVQPRTAGDAHRLRQSLDHDADWANPSPSPRANSARAMRGDVDTMLHQTPGWKEADKKLHEGLLQGERYNDLVLGSPDGPREMKLPGRDVPQTIAESEAIGPELARLRKVAQEAADPGERAAAELAIDELIGKGGPTAMRKADALRGGEFWARIGDKTEPGMKNLPAYNEIAAMDPQMRDLVQRAMFRKARLSLHPFQAHQMSFTDATGTLGRTLPFLRLGGVGAGIGAEAIEGLPQMIGNMPVGGVLPQIEDDYRAALRRLQEKQR